MKLGKKPARPGAVKLQLSDYLDTSALPTLPDKFGRENLVPHWGMLGNDTVGDCAIAGPYHETMLWNAEANRRIDVSDAVVLQTYSDVTGYNPADPSTDQGTDVSVMAAYRRNHGIVDANGKVHKIGAYVSLTPGDLTELWYALYLFDGIGIGVKFPQEWMAAFRYGSPWGAVQNPTIEGGHYVSGVGKHNGGMLGVVTWGKVQWMTPGGYQQFNDETYAYLTEEKLINGKDDHGLNLSKLRDDLVAVTQA